MPQISEVSLAYKSSQTVDELPIITSPEEAANYLRSIWTPDTLELREQFVIVLLNNAKRVLGWSLISSGGSTATIVEPSAVFQTAMLGKAESIICAHNHPSGNRKASTADVKLTERLCEAGRMLGIPVEDHIILTQSGYTSFRNKGLI